MAQTFAPNKDPSHGLSFGTVTQGISFWFRAGTVGPTLYTLISASLKLPLKILVLTQDIKEAGAFLRPFLCLKRGKAFHFPSLLLPHCAGQESQNGLNLRRDFGDGLFHLTYVEEEYAMSYASQEVMTYARDPTAVVWRRDSGSGTVLNFRIPLSFTR